MTTIATLSVLVDADISRFQRGMNSVNTGVNTMASRLRNVGTSMSTLGQNMAGVTVPLVAGFAAAVVAATEFDASMTNVNSILQLGTEEAAALSAEILAIGSNAVAGPQAVADAFYNIVGSVTNAEARIPILNTAIAVSEAGMASLDGTVAALTSSMNAYAASAEDATYFGDVLTQGVAAGVGTMDELAAALPTVTGLASEMGIEFGELVGSMALITTQGASFSEAGTQINAALTSLIDPSEQLSAALAVIGYESGRAAVDALGLQGTFQALVDSGVDLGSLGLTVEGLRGALALTGDTASEFLTNFQTGIAGATEAARAIQLEGAQAQMGLLAAAASGLAITLGTTLMNAIASISTTLTPIINDITAWAQANPELSGGITLVVAGAAALGAGLLILGPIVTALGSAVSILVSPIALVAAGFVALLATTGQLPQFSEGIGQVASGITRLVSGDSAGLWEIGDGVRNIATAIGDAAFTGITAIADGVISLIEQLTGTDLPSVAEGWTALGTGLSMAWTAIETVIGQIQTGIQLFALDIQLRVATFISELRDTILAFTGGVIDINPTIEADVAALTTQIETITNSAIDGASGTGGVNADITLTATVDSSSAQATIQASVNSLAITSTGGFGVDQGAPVAGTTGGSSVNIPSGATGVEVHREGLMYVHANERLLNAADTSVYNDMLDGKFSGGNGGGDTFNLSVYGTSPMEVLRMTRRAARAAAPG